MRSADVTPMLNLSVAKRRINIQPLKKGGGARQLREEDNGNPRAILKEKKVNGIKPEKLFFVLRKKGDKLRVLGC